MVLGLSHTILSVHVWRQVQFVQKLKPQISAVVSLPLHSENCHSLSPQKSSRELCCQPKSLPLILPHVQCLYLCLFLSLSRLHASI